MLLTQNVLLGNARRRTNARDSSSYDAPPARRSARPTHSAPLSERVSDRLSHLLHPHFGHSHATPGDPNHPGRSSPPMPSSSKWGADQRGAADDVLDDELSHHLHSNIRSNFSASRSRYTRSSRAARLRASILDYKWMNVMDAVQALLGVLSTLLWMIQSYPPYDADRTIYVFQFALSCLYIADVLVRLATYGTLYLLSKWALIDILTVLPIIYTVYQLGWIPRDTTEERGFVVWVVDLTVVWQWLTLARFLRVYKLLRIAELRRFTLWSNNELSRGLSKLLLTVLTIIILGGGLVFLIENAFSYGEQMTFQQSLYFMVVTISTVGYGDITAKTVLGQIAVMGIILIAIILIPMQTTDFIGNLHEYSKYGKAYTSSKVPHVVLVAHASMTSGDLDALLNEFFHSNHGGAQYNVVILCNGGEEHRRKLLYHVKSTRYWSQVSYIVGTPSSVSDLQKVAVSRAQAVFLITSARFLDAEQELSADEETLLRAISIKHLCPFVPLIMHIISPRNRAHVLWYQLSKFPNIQVVCLNEMKMKLFATSAMCPGMLGLVTNLLSSYDGKATLSSVFSSTAAALEMGGSTFVSTSTQTFAASSLIAHPLTLSAWPLSSAKSPDYPSPPLPPPAPDRSSSLFYSAAVRRWEEEYLFGFGQEIYTAEFPECVDDFSFSEAAAIVYERLAVVLIGVYKTDASTGKMVVMLNPGYSCKISVKAGDLACVIAQNADHARKMRDVEYQHAVGGVAGDGVGQGIVERWRREREMDRQRDAKARDKLRAKRMAARAMKRRQRRQRSHAIDIDSPRGSSSPKDGDDGKEREEDEQAAALSNSSAGDHTMTPSPDEDWDLRGEVDDALSSFRCNGQSVVPSIPVSSHIAQSNVRRPSDEEQQTDLQPQLQRTASVRSAKAIAESEGQSDDREVKEAEAEVEIDIDEGHAVNPVSGRVTVSAQEGMLDRVLEAVGLQEKEKEDVAVDHPKLLDSGANATKEEEDAKDAAYLRSTFAKGSVAAASQPSPHSSHAHNADPSPHNAKPPLSSSSSSSSPSPAASPEPAPSSSASSSADPFSSHVVICGYIDTKIINFLRRFRDSDSRTIVLVFDNAVCFPLPPPVHAYILSHFAGVEILFASSSYKLRNQRERLYLAYTDPCCGHRHDPPEMDRPEPAHRYGTDGDSTGVGNAASVDGAPKELLDAGSRAHPVMAVDEYTLHDHHVGKALHLAGEAAAVEGPPGSPDSGHEERHKPAAYSLAIDGQGSRELSYEEMLSHSNWFRRACVHLADSVLILANPYSSSSGSATMGSQAQDSTSVLGHQLLASLLSTSDHLKNASDEMTRADQYGLIIYSGIQAYLQQCRAKVCPTLHVNVTSATFNIVNIELIHYANVRLLKDDADTTEKYRPTRPQETGWAWMWVALRRWMKDRRAKTEIARAKRRRRVQAKQRRKELKRSHFAALRGTDAQREQQLDRRSSDNLNEINADSAPESEDGAGESREAEEAGNDRTSLSLIDDPTLAEEDAMFARHLEQHYRAFYTADGLMFSGKILDALIVQAFYHPLVYDTVSALVTGYTHEIPRDEYRKALKDSSTETGGKGARRRESEEREDENDRRFRVELLLVDVPEAMVGRTYGYLVMKLMLESGWVTIGLYRDRRAVMRLRKRCREKVRLTELNRKVKRWSSLRRNSLKTPPQPQPFASRPHQRARSHSQAPAHQPQAKASAAESSGTVRGRHAAGLSKSAPGTRRGSAAFAEMLPTLSRAGKPPSAIEMAEQKRRGESLHVAGLSFAALPLDVEQQAKEAERKRYLAEERRAAQRHHHHHEHHHHEHHHHEHGDGGQPPSVSGASGHQLLSPILSVTSTTGSDSRADDGFQVRVAQTIRRARERPTSRSTSQCESARSPRPRLANRQRGMSPALAGARIYDGDVDDDDDHLDTTARQHADLIALQPDTFQAPAPGDDSKQPDPLASPLPTSSPPPVRSPEPDAADGGDQRAPTPTPDGSESCSSSSESCSSEADEDEEDEDELGEVNTQYASRSLFYVLTNPPMDTILHARDRLYVLVQRWLKTSTAKQMMSEESYARAARAVAKDGQRPDAVAERSQMEHHVHAASVEDAQAGQQDDAGKVSGRAVAIPRSYSPEVHARLRDLAFPSPEDSPSPDAPHTESQRGGEQHEEEQPLHDLQQSPTSGPSSGGAGGRMDESTVRALQGQLSMQQAMLESIQKQLAALTSHHPHPHQHVSPHPQHGKPPIGSRLPRSLSNTSLGPVVERSPSPSPLSVQSPTTPSGRSANPRIHMPADEDLASYELYKHGEAEDARTRRPHRGSVEGGTSPLAALHAGGRETSSHSASLTRPTMDRYISLESTASASHLQSLNSQTVGSLSSLTGSGNSHRSRHSGEHAEHSHSHRRSSGTQ